jgi:hypothetical protein
MPLPADDLESGLMVLPDLSMTNYRERGIIPPLHE